MMRQKMVTWSLSDLLCSICSGIRLAHSQCSGRITRKTSMNSLPGVTTLEMTAPKEIGTMLGKAASAISSCASSQVVSWSNSAGRGISERSDKRIVLWFWMTKEEPMQSSYWSWWKRVCFFRRSCPDGDLMRRELKWQPAHSHGRCWPTQQCHMNLLGWQQNSFLFFIQVRKLDSGGFGAGFDTMWLRDMLTRDTLWWTIHRPWVHLFIKRQASSWRQNPLTSSSDRADHRNHEQIGTANMAQMVAPIKIQDHRMGRSPWIPRACPPRPRLLQHHQGTRHLHQAGHSTELRQQRHHGNISSSKKNQRNFKGIWSARGGHQHRCPMHHCQHQR